MNGSSNNNVIDNLENFQGWNDVADEKDFFALLDSNKKSSKEPAKQESNSDSDISLPGFPSAAAKPQPLVPQNRGEAKQQEKAPNYPAKNQNPDPDPQIEKEEDMFGKAINVPDIEGNVKQPKNTESKSSEVSKVQIFNYLKEQGLIEIPEEEEEDLELDEETAEDVLAEKFEQTFENKINERIEELFADMPGSIKQLNKFVMNGGDPQQFIKAMSNGTEAKLSVNLDLEEEKNQELVIREVMRMNEDDEDTIEAQLDFLKDSGRLQIEAQKKFDKWKIQNEREKQILLGRQQAEIQRQKELIREQKNKFHEFLQQNDAVGELSLNKEDKRVLPSYINDRTVKVNGSSITQMQKELFYDVPQNQQAMLQLAALLRNRNKDGTFNFNAIINGAKTEVVKQVKDNVRRAKGNMPSKSGMVIKTSQKSLADYFND